MPHTPMGCTPHALGLTPHPMTGRLPHSTPPPFETLVEIKGQGMQCTLNAFNLTTSFVLLRKKCIFFISWSTIFNYSLSSTFIIADIMFLYNLTLIIMTIWKICPQGEMIVCLLYFCIRCFAVFKNMVRALNVLNYMINEYEKYFIEFH